MGRTPDGGETDGIRASDQERDATVERLRDAAGEGRLTLEEFSDRMELATTAKTLLATPINAGIGDLRTARPRETTRETKTFARSRAPFTRAEYRDASAARKRTRH
ncbi:MAG TPA: DUF1707 domain-containing protein [Streptosporangiaceae bacterium]|nr:DUF1707 domain-containing protein [Streptosporangiaceae bacterium]